MNKEQSFICLGCDEKVKAYAVYSSGKRSQATHFRHTGNTGQEGGCGNYESYIHNYTKRKFAESYEYLERFELKRTIEIRCSQAKYDRCSSPVKDVVNLKERYPYIKIEKRDGSFIPDCLIFNDSGEKIYIEIKYESPVSEKKRNSGIPIIEIVVSTEESIQKIIHNASIDSSSEDITLINFESVAPNSILKYDCGGCCPKEHIPISHEEEGNNESAVRGLSLRMSSTDKLVGNILRGKLNADDAYRDWRKRMEKKYSVSSNEDQQENEEYKTRDWKKKLERKYSSPFGKSEQQSKKNKCKTEDECTPAVPEQKTFDF